MAEVREDSATARLKEDYPWIQTPLVVGAPMRLISEVDLTLAVSRAGGLGFLAGGTNPSSLSSQCASLTQHLLTHPLPTRPPLASYGIGFITWGSPLAASLSIISTHRPSAIWLFAPQTLPDLLPWIHGTRSISPAIRIWIQISSVRDALEITRLADLTSHDVLVLQGQDAGGHGQFSAASLMSLLPEVVDAFAGMPDHPILIGAGGVADSRGCAAALTLGASGIVLGTALLASPEARISPGYRAAVLASGDGGVSTVRTTVYDTVRGTLGWPKAFGGRGVKNLTWEEAEEGLSVEENRKKYEEAVEQGEKGWGFEGGKGKVVEGRMTTYAGTAVGLVRSERPAGEIVRNVREGVREVLEKAKAMI